MGRTSVRSSPRPAEDNDLDLAGAVYSADGTRIFFQKAVQVNPDNGCCQLWVMDADGSSAHRFVSDDDNTWEGMPWVSPDGQWVAFWRVLGGTGRVAIVRADGTGPIIQTGPNLTGVVDWNWAPDSSKIVMLPREAADGAPHVFPLHPAGGAGDHDGDAGQERPGLAAAGALTERFHARHGPRTLLIRGPRCHRPVIGRAYSFGHEVLQFQARYPSPPPLKPSRVDPSRS